MAADPNLIKGAAMMYQNQMVGAASEGLQKGFEQSIQPYIDKIEEDEKKAKLSEEQLGRMLNTLNSNVDGNGFTAAEQTIARNWAMSKRNEYADLAKQLSKMDYSDPNYSNVKSKLDGIKQSFENLRKNRDLLANGKKEFIEQQDNISAANRFFNPYNKEFAKIGDDGMIIYNSKDGDKRLSDTQFPELINREGLDTFRAMSDQLFKFASTGAATGNALNTVKDKMRSYLYQGNIVDSIVFDKLMPVLYDSEDTKATIEAYKRATGEQKKALKNKLIEDIIDTNTSQVLGMGKDVYRAQLAKSARSRGGGGNRNKGKTEQQKRMEELKKIKSNITTQINKMPISEGDSTFIPAPVYINNTFTGQVKNIEITKTAQTKIIGEGKEKREVVIPETIKYQIKKDNKWEDIDVNDIFNYTINMNGSNQYDFGGPVDTKLKKPSMTTSMAQSLQSQDFNTAIFNK